MGSGTAPHKQINISAIRDMNIHIGINESGINETINNLM